MKDRRFVVIGGDAAGMSAASLAKRRRPDLEVEAYDDGYAWVQHRGNEMLHLRALPGLDIGANEASAYLHVQHVDEWHAAMVASGRVGDVADMPWAMREYSFVDPSGNLVRVGSNS